MARTKNELSATQLDTPAFLAVKATIKRFSVSYLETLGNITHTTTHKWMQRKAVNKSFEDELFRVIAKAERLKAEKDAQQLATARTYITA